MRTREEKEARRLLALAIKEEARIQFKSIGRFAKLLKVSRQTIYNWASGDKFMPYDKYLDALDILNLKRRRKGNENS